ncbi:hypothetical protein [Jeongeupia naejangsanensis]|uniref:Uncharacterized protein n=1 Tax=Jeongeupia naejangsanensis TaxID=613195 RepID=A0ABS2BMY7_9NEIS|nr:hypothetical protein [Jeongeupia naejangsanensis]MBM3116361.1 hypothetical protein [Jeongeupia naejangsanensis]
MRKNSERKIRAEPATLAAHRRVSGFHAARAGGPIGTIRIGVTFRTGGNGKAHAEHDCTAIRALNQMRNKKGERLFSFEVVPVTLPRGASGVDTPLRAAQSTSPEPPPPMTRRSAGNLFREAKLILQQYGVNIRCCAGGQEKARQDMPGFGGAETLRR